MFTKLPGALSGVYMMNASTGWAVTWDLAGSGSYTILRTGDGGLHWKATLTCTPTQGEGKGFVAPCDTDFRSASVATVTQPEYDQQSQSSRLRIFHTADGGQTWQSTMLVARNLETPATFLDDRHGWALVTEGFPGPDPGSAYIGQEISLYRTDNGGQSWQRVAHGPATSQLGATSDDAYGVAPLTANARMSFSSLSTGWLAGTTLHQDGSGSSWLYVTHDGGSSWQPTSLSPAGNASDAPVFFTPQDGLLVASVAGTNALGETQTSRLYTTHDGGTTWSSLSLPFDITNGGFIDMQHAWALVTNTNIPGSLTATAVGSAQATPGGSDNLTTTTLNFTSDGWHHWTTQALHIPFKQVYGFDFVSPGIGWALAENRTAFFPEPGGGRRKGDIIALLKTTDGGQTWHEITYSQV